MPCGTRGRSDGLSRRAAAAAAGAIAALSTLSAVCAPSAGAQAPAGTQPYPLGEVVVSARRPVSESAATLRRVTADDIRAYGARTLDEALALLPGVEVRTGGGGVPRIDVRGFRGRHLVLLLDGIPLNSTFDGQADPSLVPVEEIAEIKLAPGTGSVLYEQGGLGGVIDIVTRRGAPGVAAEATAERRAGDAWLGRASASGGTRRVDFFASGSAYDGEGYPSVAGSPSLGPSPARTRANSDRRRTNAFGSLTARPTDHLQLGAVVSGVSAAYGLPPNAVADPADRFANRPVFERVEDSDGLSAHVAASWAPAGPLGVRSWAFVNRLAERHNRYDDSTYSSMDDPTVRGTYREHARTRLTGAATQVTAAAGRLGRLTLGLSAERDAWETDLTVRDVPVVVSGGGTGGGGGKGGGTATAKYDVRTVADARSLRRYAIQLEDEIHPTARTGLVLGYAHHWLDEDSTGSDDAGAASAAAYVDLTSGTRLRAAAARTIRFPTIRQLYGADGGNAALRTEYATTAELGVEQALPARSAVTLAGFRTDARNYIERPTQGAPFENNDAYRFAGVEATAETRVVPALLLRARYTWLEARDRSPGSAREELQYRPRHRGSVEGRYDFPFGLSAALAVLRVADQVYYSRQAPIAQRRLPDYTLANARVARSLFGGATSVYLGVDNLFDARYEEEYGSPAATRVVYGGVSAGWRAAH